MIGDKINEREKTNPLPSNCNKNGFTVNEDS